VIQPLAGYRNLWLATGHYRNGVLLAPATALAIRDALEHLD
jgi:glycine/D-amino acid oxidase-like deaminating enzyme